MKNRLFRTAAVLPVLLSVQICICAAVMPQYDTGMTMVCVGTEEKELYIEPGTYFMSGAEQIRITDSKGDVTFFRGQLPDMNASVAELKDGGAFEYMGRVYLTLIAPQGSELDAKELTLEKYSAMGPLRYDPVKGASMLALADGCMTVIDNGRITVYNMYGDRSVSTYRGYISGLSGYILNRDIDPERERTDTAERKQVTELDEGREYSVGKDIAAGEYSGSGSGMVRVYDEYGYPKTVIRLKEAGDSVGDGVESYTFRLGENEKVITEGRIRFEEAAVR